MYKLLFLLVFSVNISSAFCKQISSTINFTPIVTPVCKDADLEKECDVGKLDQARIAGKQLIANNSPKNTCLDETVTTVETCCTDPTKCLGKETLVTIQAVNQQVAMYAPLTTMVAQTLSGKDLSGLCAASGALAGAGATISASAAITCKKEVLNCTSACDQLKKTKCEEYKTAVDACKTLPLDKQKFTNTVIIIKMDIEHTKKITTKCNAVKMKAEALTENGKSMLQSAAGATVCAKQASINNKKNNTSNTKKSPISKKQNEDIIGESSDVAITQTGNSMIPNSRNATNNGGNVSGVGSGGNEDQSTLSGSKIAIPNTENNLDTNNINNPDNELSSSHSKSKGLSGRSISSQFGNYNGSSKRSSKYYNDDDKHTGLNYQARSGGGFSGYKGARNRKDYYASIGLTKKQIKKFRNKKQTKRKTIFSSKGTHQNIFERVSKQLQSMCYKTLDCN